MSNHRLSQQQIEVLDLINMRTQPMVDFPEGLPVYAGPTFLSDMFHSEADRDRWLKNLEKRGFITRSGNAKCFLRLTDLGREALATKQKA